MIDIQISGVASAPRKITGIRHVKSAILDIEGNLVIVENVELFPELKTLANQPVVAKVNPCSFMIFDGTNKTEIIFSLESIVPYN